MLYNEQSCKRVKGSARSYVNWVHTTLKLNDYHLVQCFFCEHLLSRYPVKPVAIVESEKTALICSCVYPDSVWIATGSLNGLNANKCKVLQGRDVILYPDISCYDKWKREIKIISESVKFNKVSVSKVLETLLDLDKGNKGLDLADFLSHEL